MISAQIMNYIREHPHCDTQEIATSLNLMMSTVQCTLVRYVKTNKVNRKKVDKEQYVCGPKKIYVYYLT